MTRMATNARTSRLSAADQADLDAMACNGVKPTAALLGVTVPAIDTLMHAGLGTARTVETVSRALAGWRAGRGA